MTVCEDTDRGADVLTNKRSWVFACVCVITNTSYTSVEGGR
ncbi:hypothetical protein [Fulvivirga ligni]|nr:hypothetical protein [Fulvivirga ligni]